jgi:uncharacterized protein
MRGFSVLSANKYIDHKRNIMALPLMPKATAVWLVENTSLSFEQIAEFCGLHPLEVQGIADGEVAVGIQAQSPIDTDQLTQENIELCEANPKERLKLNVASLKHLKKRTKGSRYTPVARRQDKPEAIAWLLKHHPYIPDSKIVKLIGTTKKTIESIREKTHWNMQNMTPKDPVLLGLCNQSELDSLVEKLKPADHDVQEMQSSSASSNPFAIFGN